MINIGDRFLLNTHFGEIEGTEVEILTYYSEDKIEVDVIKNGEYIKTLFIKEEDLKEIV